MKNSRVEVCLRRLVGILAMLMLFAAWPLQSLAASYQGVELEVATWDKTSKAYLINNRAKLLWWAINKSNYSIKLTADIHVQDDGVTLVKQDTKGYSLKADASKVVTWPALYYYTSSPEIDGNGHTIYGLYQKGGYGENGSRGNIKSYDYVGFIQFSKPNLNIHDLTIADSWFEGKYAGGFMAQKSKVESTSKTTFTNCAFRGYVKGDVYAGGIVGWYRTDGQDAQFYRCFNFGGVTVGKQGETNTERAAGGIVGYFDICHTPFAKANTKFDRCVNYGDITNLSKMGNVGGIAGYVWDNNTGDREWRFCFNFGYVRKTDAEGKTLFGSGLLGNYHNVNGKSKPKLLSCGNARESATGALLDSCTWNFRDNESPIVLQGARMAQSAQFVSSLQKDESWGAWINNYWKEVTAGGVALALMCIGFAVMGFAAFAKLMLEGLRTIWGLLTNITGTLSAPLTDVLFGLFVTAVATSPIALGSYATMSFMLRRYYLSHPSASIIAQLNLPIDQKELYSGGFAYDANLMMQADSIGGEPNTDKSILFAQHVNQTDAAKNDSLPYIVAAEGHVDDGRLVFGYKDCDPRLFFGNYEGNINNAPSEHQYDENGICKVCKTSHPQLQNEGKEDEYYAIKTFADLNYVADVFNGVYDEKTYNELKGKTFKLENDITFPINTTWTPIGGEGKTTSMAGAEETQHPFCGRFDGQGHTISGLYMMSGGQQFGGLFGCVEGANTFDNTKKEYTVTPTVITNFKLKNCAFTGKDAGGLVGKVIDAVEVSRVGIEPSVNVSGSENAGGMFGELNTRFDGHVYYCYSYANLTFGAKNTGAYIGYISRNKNTNTNGDGKDIDLTGNYSKAGSYFEGCVYGGHSTSSKWVGDNDETLFTILKEGYRGDDGFLKNVKYFPVFNNCYSSASDKEQKLLNSDYVENDDEFVVYDLRRDQMNDGEAVARLQSWNNPLNANIAEGQPKYYFIQNGKQVDFATSVYAPAMKLAVYTTDGVCLGDTIINLSYRSANDYTKVSLPLNYAGVSYNHATLSYEDNGVMKEEEEDNFNFLYNHRTDWSKYKNLRFIVDENQHTLIFDIWNLQQWRSLASTIVDTPVNLMTDLDASSYCMPRPVLKFDGHGHTFTSDQPLYTGSFPQSKVEVTNLHFVGPVLAKDICTADAPDKITLKVSNSLLDLGAKYDKATISAISSITDDSKEGSYEFKNVAYRYKVSDADGYEIGFYTSLPEAGSSNPAPTKPLSPSKTFRDNDGKVRSFLTYLYDHQYDLLYYFGLRLDDRWQKNDQESNNYVSKISLANDSTRIYRGLRYSMATGKELKETLEGGYQTSAILMNADGKLLFKPTSTTDGVFVNTQNIINNQFVVLNAKRAELSQWAFDNLPANVITSDGYARLIHLTDDSQFAYPETFVKNNITIHATRAEYVRSVPNDQLWVTVAMPFDFATIEYDKEHMGDLDKIELAFFNPADKNYGIQKDGTVFNIRTLANYTKEQQEVFDPKNDQEHVYFTGGVPYLIASYAKGESTTLTFVGNDVDLLREPSKTISPLMASFTNCEAQDLGADQKVYILAVYDDEQAEMPYEKFVRVTPDYNLKAFRGYLILPANATNSIRLSIDSNNMGGEVTGIDQAVKNARKAAGTYDLSGRKLNPSFPFKYRGVVIKDGKKVINN